MYDSDAAFRPLTTRRTTTTGEGRVVPRLALDDPVATGTDERARRIWGAGAYDRIAAGFRDEAAAFVERLALGPDELVLDAACGSGNLTIPAARTGARVLGLDIAASLLAEADAWSAREGLAIRLTEGSVEEMPYADAAFSTVMSMFGVMFAARPERVVDELARVTRPGGRVALANWTRTGFVGQMLARHVKFVPAPAGIPSPLFWGDEDVIRARFNERTWQVTTRTRMLTFRYPHSPAGTAELFRGSYGPTVRTFEALDEDQRARFAAELASLWASHHREGAPDTEVESEYLEVIAIRR